MTQPRISLLPLRTPHTWCSLLLSLALLCACGQHKRDPGTNGAFAKAPQTEGATLARISEGGELIIATLSGPDTYFDYQGKAMGLQYALAEDFAAHADRSSPLPVGIAHADCPEDEERRANAIKAADPGREVLTCCYKPVQG